MCKVGVNSFFLKICFFRFLLHRNEKHLYQTNLLILMFVASPPPPALQSSIVQVRKWMQKNYFLYWKVSIRSNETSRILGAFWFVQVSYTYHRLPVSHSSSECKHVHSFGFVCLLQRLMSFYNGCGV